MSFIKVIIYDICEKIINTSPYDGEENYRMGPYQHAHHSCHIKEYGITNERIEDE